MKHRAMIMFGLAGLSAVAALAGESNSEKSKATTEVKSVYDFTMKDIDGKDVKLSSYKGKVCLIVNVASQCGFTKSTYAGLESIHQKYKEQGLTILAFPANNFGSQEPGSNETIKAFCTNEMHATFDLFAKISVMGEDQDPLYQYLTHHPDETIQGPVVWNFQKYLIGRDGTVLAKWGPRTLPEDEAVVKAIEKALAVK